MSHRGRFAPSPTGVMHLGNVWTALLAWLACRVKGGRMVLRMEDLDPDRSKPHLAERIMRDLSWLGLDWDEGPDKPDSPHPPYRQSERGHLYARALESLAEQGLVYPCWCTRASIRAQAQASAGAPHPSPHGQGPEGVPPYPGVCRRLPLKKRLALECSGRRPAMRLAAPAHELISFEDERLGHVELDVGLGGDLVLRRSDGVHAYQLAVVVDDADQEITQVVRGEDLVDSTPVQLLLYRALGLKAPRFAHVPLLVDASGVRLSKRQQSLGLDAIQARGITPGRVIGLLARKAGLVDQEREVNPWELVDGFDLKRLPAGPVVVEEDSLV